MLHEGPGPLGPVRDFTRANRILSALIANHSGLPVTFGSRESSLAALSIIEAIGVSGTSRAAMFYSIFIG
jgi:hypothetical protein